MAEAYLELLKWFAIAYAWVWIINHIDHKLRNLLGIH